MSVNTVTISGNLTRDPELRFLASGAALLTFSIAFNKRVKNDQGVYEDGEPQFFDVKAWRVTAERAADSLGKGSAVTIVGRLEQESWEADDGSKRSKVVIVADEIGVNTFQMDGYNRRQHQENGGSSRPRSNGAGSRTRQPARTGATSDYDEEPF